MKNLESKKKERTKSSRDGVTRYERNGVECFCNSKRPREGKEKEEAWSARPDIQVEIPGVFGVVSSTVKALFRALGVHQRWNSFAGGLTTTGRSLCIKINTPCFDARGVFNFRAFVFSLGWLANPLYTRIKREGWTVTVEWEDRCHRRSNRGTDRLVVGYFYHSLPDAPRVLADTGARRADGRATFTIPHEGYPLDSLPPGELLHIYPFFAREGAADCSRSLYFRVPEGADGEV